MFADMDPIIAIAIAIGWAIISAIFRKKKDADEWAEWEETNTKPQPKPPREHAPGPHTLDPFPTFPMPPRIPRKEAKPPPVEEHVPETEGPARQLSNVWGHAQEALAKAHRDQDRARERLKQLESKVRPTPAAAAHHKQHSAHRIVAKLRRPDGIREAVLASVILAPPKALEG